MTGPADARTLPLRVPIADGEALDSWLERLGRRCDMPIRQLLPVFGVGPRAVPGSLELLHFPAAVLRRIEDQGGLAPKPAAGQLTDPLLLAAVAVRAVDLLTAVTPGEIVARLKPLLSMDSRDRDARGHRQRMPTGAYWIRTLTPARQATLLGALDPLLAPLDRLRYRTCTTRPSIPSHRALIGRAGPERLRRFAIAMTYPTITETARALGVSNATIIQQLQRSAEEDPQRPDLAGASSGPRGIDT